MRGPGARRDGGVLTLGKKLNTSLQLTLGYPDSYPYATTPASSLASGEPTKIWADFETTTVQHLESLVWSKYAKRKGLAARQARCRRRRIGVGVGVAESQLQRSVQFLPEC